MTYSILLKILMEAEGRYENLELPQEVRARSQETIKMCNQRMDTEGINRSSLQRLAESESLGL